MDGGVILQCRGMSSTKRHMPVGRPGRIGEEMKQDHASKTIMIPQVITEIAAICVVKLLWSMLVSQERWNGNLMLVCLSALLG